MHENSTQRRDEIRALIEAFISERPTIKNKMPAKRGESPAETENLELFKLVDGEQREVYRSWLSHAAQRASQIHYASHVLKGTHSDARGTDLLCLPEEMTEHKFVGSWCLRGEFEPDVAGNAASLDVNKFLQLNYEGSSLLELMKDGDSDLASALDDDVEQSQKWMMDFCRVAEPSITVSSHSLAKQVYWLVGDGADPTNDDQYQLLSPLYASSLAHYVFQLIESHIFSQSAREAQAAKRNGEYSDYQVHQYNGLAIQKLGGSKPQNISVLNSQRHGDNYLLSSVPPNWKTRDVTPPFGQTRFFDLFGKRHSVAPVVQKLKKFLESDPPNNKITRDHRDNLLDQVFGELFQYVEELHTLEPGWSTDKRCQLADVEKLWLDKGRCAIDKKFAVEWFDTDWRSAVRHRFANWLNHALGGTLPLGDIEHAFWMDMMESEAWNQSIAADIQTLVPMEDGNV